MGMSQATLKAAAVLIAIGVTAGGYALLPRPAQMSAPAAQPKAAPKIADKAPPKPAPVPPISLATALEQKRIRAEFTGNGKNKIVLSAHNADAQPIRIHLAAGQLFASATSTVALARSAELKIEPNSRKTQEFATVATSSANTLAEEKFEISAAKLPPRLDVFF